MNLPPRREAVRRFWVAIGAGASIDQAVASLGLGYSGKTGYLWFGQAGGVVPAYVAAQSSGWFLSFAEREEIHAGVSWSKALHSWLFSLRDGSAAWAA